MPASADFQKQVEGYGLTTLTILYRKPDAPTIINPHPFVYQLYDIFPHFPETKHYLEFWDREIEGRLHSVLVAHCKLIKPAEIRIVNGGEFRLQ